MTKVRMLIQVSGSRDGVDWPPIGGVLDVPKEEAETLYLNRQAAPAGDKDAEIEAATINHDPEVAVVGTVPVADHHAPAKAARRPRAAAKAKTPAEAVHEAPKPAAQVGTAKAGLTTDALGK